jgi:hypothetical protein
MHVEFDPRLYSLSSNPELFSKRSGFLIGVLRKGSHSYTITCTAFHPNAELDTRLEHIVAILQRSDPACLSAANPLNDYRISLKQAELALRLSQMAAKSNASRETLRTSWWGKLLLKLPLIKTFFSHWHTHLATSPHLAGHCLVSAIDRRLQELSPYDPDLPARIQRVLEHYLAYVQGKPLLTANDPRFIQLERLRQTLSYLYEHQALEKDMRASTRAQLEQNRHQLERQIRQAERTHFQLYKTVGHPIWATLQKRLMESHSRLLQPMVPQLTAAAAIQKFPLEYTQPACEAFLHYTDEDDYYRCEEKLQARLKTLELPENEFNTLPPASKELLEAARTKLRTARGYLIAQHLLRCKQDQRSFKQIVESEYENAFVVNASAMLDLLSICYHPDAKEAEAFLSEAFKKYLLGVISMPLRVVQSARQPDAAHRYYPYAHFHNFHMTYTHAASCFTPLLALLNKTPGSEELAKQVHQSRGIAEQIYLAQARREVSSYALAIDCQLPDAPWKRLPVEAQQEECRKLAEKLKTGRSKLQGHLSPYTEQLQHAHDQALDHLRAGYAQAECMLIARTPAPLDRSHQAVLLHLLRINTPFLIGSRMQELKEWAFPVPQFAAMKKTIENAYQNDERWRRLQKWAEAPRKWKKHIDALPVEQALAAYKQVLEEVQSEQNFAALQIEVRAIFLAYMQDKLAQNRAADHVIREFSLTPPVLSSSLHAQTQQMEFLIEGALRSIHLNAQQAAYPAEVLQHVDAARQKLEQTRLEWVADRILLVEANPTHFADDSQRICAALDIADLAVHKRAWQTLIQQLHPDKHPDLPGPLKNKLDAATRYLLKHCRI